MNDIEKKYLATVAAALTRMGCQFAIIDADGEKHGDLDVAPKRLFKRRRSVHALGELKDHINAHMPFPLEIGEVAIVPAGKFGLDAVRSSISAGLVKEFGAKSHTTMANKATDCVEVMRVA